MATGAVGDTTTTDQRSRRNRSGRRGGQLLTRARGSSSGSACPRFVLPAPRSPDGHTIREDHAIPTGCSSATSIMPVTNYVERQNLTIRMSMRRFTRLINASSKEVENLKAAVALRFAHYNFVRVHSTLRMTPAMASGITPSLWTLNKLIEEATT